jgi:hypothetical protein
MRDQAHNNHDHRIKWGWWLLVSALVAALLGCSPGSGTGTGQVIILADAEVEEPPDASEESCDLHPDEEASDDGCCGCHPYSEPENCDPECQPPPPDPCEDTPAGTQCVDAGIPFDGNTYYRIGKGVDPRAPMGGNAGEYEFEAGQMGEGGKIKKNGGANNVGVSFWSTKQAAIAARMRLGSNAKIHRVTFYPNQDLIFIAHPPANHYHLVPNKAGMTLGQYKAALKKVKLIKDDP